MTYGKPRRRPCVIVAHISKSCHTMEEAVFRPETAMKAQMTEEIITPTDQERRIARASSKALAPLLESNGTSDAHVRVNTSDNHEADLTLPSSLVRLLFNALKEMAKGHSVSLLPVYTELTTRQAADVMHVSHHYLVKLVDSGNLPCRKLGSRRRIRYEDLSAYLEREKKARSGVLKDLVAEQELLGLYE